MSKPTKNLRDLTNTQLEGRLYSAEQRIYALKDELNRRKRIVLYGSENPELQEFNIVAITEFSVMVQAKDEADAIRVFEESGWLDWDDTQPGGAVIVDDYGLTHEAPLAVETIRTDVGEWLKQIVGAGGTANSAH